MHPMLLGDTDRDVPCLLGRYDLSTCEVRQHLKGCMRPRLGILQASSNIASPSARSQLVYAIVWSCEDVSLTDAASMCIVYMLC